MMTQEQIEEFKEITNQLIQWMNNNTNPHAKVIVDCTSAELVYGELCNNNEEYLKD